MDQETIIDGHKVASMLGCSYVQALILARKGILPHFRVGNAVKFRRSDIETFIEEQIEASTKKQKAIA